MPDTRKYIIFKEGKAEDWPGAEAHNMKKRHIPGEDGPGILQSAIDDTALGTSIGATAGTVIPIQGIGQGIGAAVGAQIGFVSGLISGTDDTGVRTFPQIKGLMMGIAQGKAEGAPLFTVTDSEGPQKVLQTVNKVVDGFQKKSGQSFPAGAAEGFKENVVMSQSPSTHINSTKLLAVVDVEQQDSIDQASSVLASATGFSMDGLAKSSSFQVAVAAATIIALFSSVR